MHSLLDINIMKILEKSAYYYHRIKVMTIKPSYKIQIDLLVCEDLET